MPEEYRDSLYQQRLAPMDRLLPEKSLRRTFESQNLSS